MNQNDQNDATATPRETRPKSDLYTEAELRALAEDIVRWCPGMAQLLVALGTPKGGTNPLSGMN